MMTQSGLKFSVRERGGPGQESHQTSTLPNSFSSRDWEHSSLPSQQGEMRKQVRPASLLVKFTALLTVKRKRREQKGKHVQEGVPPASSLYQNSLTPNNYPLSTRNVSRQIFILLFVRNLKAKQKYLLLAATYSAARVNNLSLNKHLSTYISLQFYRRAI